MCPKLSHMEHGSCDLRSDMAVNKWVDLSRKLEAEGLL